MKGLIRDVFLLIQAALKGHWIAFGIWAVFQLAVLATFHLWYRVDALAELNDNRTFWNSNAYSALMMLFAAAQGWLALLLGWIFNARRSGSWLRHLPVTNGAMLLAPAALLFAHGAILGAAMADLWFFDAVLRSNAVFYFLLVLPLSALIAVRNMRLLASGALLAGTIVLVSFWAYNAAILWW